MWALPPACDRGCRKFERGEGSGENEGHGAHRGDQALRLGRAGRAQPRRECENRNHRYPSHPTSFPATASRGATIPSPPVALVEGSATPVPRLFGRAGRPPGGPRGPVEGKAADEGGALIPTPGRAPFGGSVTRFDAVYGALEAIGTEWRSRDTSSRSGRDPGIMGIEKMMGLFMGDACRVLLAG